MTLGLLALVVAAAVGLILPANRRSPTSSGAPARAPIVDEQPLTTARAMAALASDWDELRY